MDNIIIKGLYLLKDNNDLLKIKLENSLENSLLMTFEKYFLENANNIKSLKEYPTILAYNIDDITQKSFYKTESEVPYFWEIKTKLLRWTFQEIDSTAKIEDIQWLKIVSWVLHIEWFEGHDKKDIILFQSFYKANMYIAKSFWESKISMVFTSRWSIFTGLNDSEILNLRKDMDVISLDNGIVYVLNAKRYDTIFNFPAELRKHIWKIFKDTFLSNPTIFEHNVSDMPALISIIEESYPISKKVYSVYRKGIMTGFNMKKFLKHLRSEGIIWVINSTTGKIIVQQAWFELLLDALNQSLYTSWNGQKYLAKAKTER